MCIVPFKLKSLYKIRVLYFYLTCLYIFGHICNHQLTLCLKFIHPHLATLVKKEWVYTSTPHMALWQAETILHFAVSADVIKRGFMFCGW
jgi:hypothetical protein